MVAKRWQYPARIEPVLDESQRPETVLPDKYWQQPSEPLHAPPRSHAALFAGPVLVEFGVPTPAIPEIGWLVEHRQPSARPHIQQTPAADFVLDESQRPLFLDKWWQEASRPPRAIPRSEAALLAGPELVLDESQRPLFLDKWWRPPSEPSWPRAPIQQPPGTELVLDDAQRPETTTVDRYWVQGPDPRRLRAWQPGESPVLIEVEAPVVPEMSWWRPASEPVQPLPPRQGYYVLAPWDESLFPITLDKWWVQYHNPTLPVPPRLWAPIDLPWDETLFPITLEKWWLQYHNPVLPLPRIQGYIVLLEFAAPPGIAVVYVFQECQVLSDIIHPQFWESAVVSSGYIPPIEEVPVPSGYIAEEDGTAPWDMVR